MRTFRPSAAIAIPAVMFCAAAPIARAQTDLAAMAHHAAANQLGLLEFCQGRGDVGNDAVGAERTVMGRLPASSVSTDSDESLGRNGTLAAPNGQTMTLASIAAQHGTTVSAFCKQLGDSAVRSAAINAGGGGGMMSGLPGGMKMPPMPNGMTAPSMPGGMSMPSMNGQGMPSTGGGTGH